MPFQQRNIQRHTSTSSSLTKRSFKGILVLCRFRWPQSSASPSLYPCQMFFKMFLQISLVVPKTKYTALGPIFFFCQCLNCLQTRLFCKSIIPGEIKSSGQMRSSGSVKIRFKAFWELFSKNYMRPWIRRLRFSLIFTPRGRLSD